MGLIVPTGGGKTRIANNIALKWLKANDLNEVCWVTHRVLLEDQAEETFLELMRAQFRSSDWQDIRRRMHFKQVSTVSDTGLPPASNIYH